VSLGGALGRRAAAPAKRQCARERVKGLPPEGTDKPQLARPQRPPRGCLKEALLLQDVEALAEAAAGYARLAGGMAEALKAQSGRTAELANLYAEALAAAARFVRAYRAGEPGAAGEAFREFAGLLGEEGR